jgi:hypothetical protein
MRYLSLLSGLAAILFARLGHSQQLPDTTARIVALPDVTINSTASRLVVATGLEGNNTNHLIAPGGGNALRFLAPHQYHELRQVRLHLLHANKLREGQIQVRVASVSVTGGPADDNLLPSSVVLTTADLLRARKYITLQWPTAQLVVPKQGLFIVIEGLGQSADEYVSRVLMSEKRHEALRYEIRRRSQPETPARLAEALDFPKLKSTKPDPSAAESWYRDTVTREWRRSRIGQSVILVEAVFE